MSGGFFWVLLAIVLYGSIHSALASLGIKALVVLRLGEKPARYYRLFYNLFAGIALLPVLALVAVLPDGPLYTIPTPWVVLTVTLQAACGVCFLLGLTQTGSSDFLGLGVLFHPAQPVQPQKLAVNGFYRWVRHPLYFFGLVLMWLTPVMTWNMLGFSLGATLYIIIGAVLEERKLLAEFGQSYAAYRQKTPFLIPFVNFNN